MKENTQRNPVTSGEKPGKMTLKMAGMLIRLARIEKGYKTQGDLANAVGLDKDLINAMENGRQKAGMQAYDKVAELLGIQFDITFPIQEGRDNE